MYQASNDSGEHGSTGGGSVGASDMSWEQVEEKDSHMTLWVPDHVVTHCAECQQEFWMVRRKHHCRYIIFLFVVVVDLMKKRVLAIGIPPSCPNLKNQF